MRSKLVPIFFMIVVFLAFKGEIHRFHYESCNRHAVNSWLPGSRRIISTVAAQQTQSCPLSGGLLMLQEFLEREAHKDPRRTRRSELSATILVYLEPY